MGVTEEKKEGLITLFLKNCLPRMLVDLQNVHRIKPEYTLPQEAINILVVVTFRVEREESSDCSDCLLATCLTCAVAILNRYTDEGAWKINDALSLLNLYLVAATCRRSVHGAATTLLSLILSLQSVAGIQTSSNSCDDRSDKDFHKNSPYHTRRIVAATCRLVCPGLKNRYKLNQIDLPT